MKRTLGFRVRLALLGGLLLLGGLAFAVQGLTLSEAEKAIEAKIATLRSVPDAQRGAVTKDLALQIRKLPADSGKVLLAEMLGNLSTEGDFGHDTLQEVATTLAGALAEQPTSSSNGQPNFGYLELAQLERYEHVKVSIKSDEYKAALAKVDETDKVRQSAGFTLTDLTGHEWTLSSLRGKVVLVNFWATWCPPCRKEIPDLAALYGRFKKDGLVVLAISDEKKSVVEPFVSSHGMPYPVLLDPGRKVNELYRVDGIPKSFVYDRKGRLVATAIDMRTQRQLLEMLAHAGLK